MVVSTKRTIIIETKFIQKGFKKWNDAAVRQNQTVTQQARAFSEASKQGKRTKETLENTRIASSRFSQVMRLNRERLGKFNNEGRKMTTFGGRMANKFRMMTHGARGFRMEMLGIMFFGMMLNRVFSGLIRTSLEWMGVMEIFSLTLGILFLPIAELVLSWALTFLDVVLNLSEAQKKMIGRIVLFGIALGASLFLLGTFALGIGSLILIFGAFASPLALILLGLGALAIMPFVSTWFNNLGKAAEDADLKLAGFGISGDVIQTLLNKIEEKLPILRDWIIGLKDKFISWFKESVPSWIEAGGEFIISLLEGFIKNAEKIGDFIKKMISKFMEFIDKHGGEFINAGLVILQKILDGLIDNLDILSEFISELVSALVKFVGENADEFLKIGFLIAGSIIEGMIEGIINLGIKVGNAITGLFGIEAKTGPIDLKRVDKSRGFKHGGIVPGRFGTPVPIIAHAGERITPVGGRSGGEINLSVTYNVNVSDKVEFESMLRENNIRLTEDVRRLIKV